MSDPTLFSTDHLPPPRPKRRPKPPATLEPVAVMASPIPGGWALGAGFGSTPPMAHRWKGGKTSSGSLVAECGDAFVPLRTEPGLIAGACPACTPPRQ